MNSVIQILSNAGSASVLPGQTQPSAGNAATVGQEFNVLLNMLASLLGNGVQPASTENQQTPVTTASQAGSNSQSSSGSNTHGGNTTIASVEQQLLEIMSSDNQQPKQGQATKTQAQKPTTFMVAGVPFIPLPQILNISQNATAVATGTQPPTAEIPSSIQSKIEQQISALLDTNVMSSSGAISSLMTKAAAQPSNADGSVSVTPTNSENINTDSAANADLMKLLSAATGPNPDPKAVKELNGLLEQIENGNGKPVADLLQQLKDNSAVVASKQQTPQVQPTGVATPSAAIQQPAAPIQDVNVIVAQASKVGTQRIAVNAAQVPQIQSASVVTTNPTSQQVPGIPLDTNAVVASAPKTSTANPTVNVAQVSSLNNASINPVSNPTVSAVPLTDTNTTQDKSTTNGGNQTVNHLNSVMASQDAHVTGSQLNQDKQNSSDSGTNLPDLLKQSAAQTYANSADSSKTNVSFRQTLSAAAQNSPVPDTKPDISLIAQNIVKEVNVMTQEGKTVVNMKLQPEDLGTVVLRVSSDAGKISAEFNVKTPDARVYLESSIPQMKQALQTNGISLTHLSVNLSNGDSQNRHPQYQAKKQQSKFYVNAAATETVEATRSFGYNTMEVKV